MTTKPLEGRLTVASVHKTDYETHKWTNGFKKDHSGAQKSNRFQSGFRVYGFLRKISGFPFPSEFRDFFKQNKK